MSVSLADRLLVDAPQLMLTVVIAIVLILAHGAGMSARSHVLRRGGAEAEESFGQAGIIVSSVLGLVALLIGFTFSLAVSGYDKRQAAAVDEASAIYSSYLAAQACSGPSKAQAEQAS